MFLQIDFSPEASWIPDQTVERILRVHRVYVISVNLCGCTLKQESSFRRISKITLISLKNSYIFDVIKNMIRICLCCFAKGQCRNLQELDLSECPHLNASRIHRFYCFLKKLNLTPVLFVNTLTG